MICRPSGPSPTFSYSSTGRPLDVFEAMPALPAFPVCPVREIGILRENNLGALVRDHPERGIALPPVAVTLGMCVVRDWHLRCLGGRLRCERKQAGNRQNNECQHNPCAGIRRRSGYRQYRCRGSDGEWHPIDTKSRDWQCNPIMMLQGQAPQYTPSQGHGSALHCLVQLPSQRP